MPNHARPEPLCSLQATIDAIGRDAPAPRRFMEPPAPPPAARAEAFGAWLLAQHDRGDWIDQLAAAARADRGFPKRGSPDEVRARLQLHGADGDTFEQLDDAERCWGSL